MYKYIVAGRLFIIWYVYSKLLFSVSYPLHDDRKRWLSYICVSLRRSSLHISHASRQLGQI